VIRICDPNSSIDSGTSLYSITARRWNLFNSIVRRIISDYGTALCVLLWTLVSLIPQDTPAGDDDITVGVLQKVMMILRLGYCIR